MLQQAPIVLFFELAYIISWGSYCLAGGPVYFAFGPFLAALAIVVTSHGWTGLRHFLRQTLRLRAPIRSYLIAVALPIAIVGAAVGLSAAAGLAIPSRAIATAASNFIFVFPVALVDAPLWEEVAWRGYAMPLFPANRSRVANTLILAALLAGWHLPLALAVNELAIPYTVCTLASAIVTNWVYYHSGERVLVAVLFHATQNFATGFVVFRTFAGTDLQQVWWFYAATYVVVALLALAQLRSRPIDTTCDHMGGL